MFQWQKKKKTQKSVSLTCNIVSAIVKGTLFHTVYVL